ncbi:MAG: hypothetical protein WC843_04810 [Candidatus Gracilibacteria bacterium]|jgi:hypothetical protein
MSINLPKTRAETKGWISVQHSLSSASPRYFLLVPHDSSRLAFPDEVKKFFPKEVDLLKQVLEIKRDKGPKALTDYIINHVPGGIAVSIEVARGILDLNRRPEFALGTVINPDISEDAKKILLDIHESIIESIEQLLAVLPETAKMLCLHSMHTNLLPDVKAGFSKKELQAYILSRENGVGVGPETKVDIITGPKDEEDLADLKMRDIFGTLFEKNCIPWAENEPYAAERNIHKTTDYMIARPGRVLVMDFPKRFLCKGSVSDKTLSMVNTEPDPAKIKKIGEIFVEALGES